MSELPVNCILNKGITGCGATTLAIQQDYPTIIAVPFVGLIQNKLFDPRNVMLGIYGEGDKRDEISQYVNSHPKPKIMTTYDSLPKVCSILSSLAMQPYKRYRLVVDE